MFISLSINKRYFLILFALYFSSVCLAQKEDYNWLGGYDYNPTPGSLIIEGYRIDFNNKPFRIDNNVDVKYGIEGNNASINDKNGNLLFYTNGCAVMDRNLNLMPNGDSINSGKWFDLFRQYCSIGYPGFQDVLILNDPAFEYGYYIFHKPNIYYPQIDDSLQLHYSYVDMRLNNGLGDVTVKNKRYVQNQNLLSSYFTAIKHQNKISWWIIQPLEEDSLFLTFLLDETGINRSANQNTHQFFDRWRSSASGTAKFSPDGTKYAIYNYFDQLHVYDFNRENGVLTKHQKVEIYPPDEIDRVRYNFGSVEWSPNSRFVYCASQEKLHQVDTWENNLQDGITLIDTFNGTLDPFPTIIFLMAQGPDCRIYITPKCGCNSIHVINKPDEKGAACDFVQNGIKFLYPNGGTLPNFPRFRVDEEEKCDPTITSIFGDAVFYRKKLSVYPNPSYGIYQLKIPTEFQTGNLVVSDVFGKIVYNEQIEFNPVTMELDLTHLPTASYNIDLYPENNNDRIFYGVQVIKI